MPCPPFRPPASAAGRKGWQTHLLNCPLYGAESQLDCHQVKGGELLYNLPPNPQPILWQLKMGRAGLGAEGAKLRQKRGQGHKREWGSWGSSRFLSQRFPCQGEASRFTTHSFSKHACQALGSSQGTQQQTMQRYCPLGACIHSGS